MNARTTIFTAATTFALTLAAAAPAAQPNYGQRPLQIQAQHDSPTSLRVELTSDRHRHGDFRRLQVRIYRGAPSDQGGEHESTAEATGVAQDGRMTFQLALSEQAGTGETKYVEVWRRSGRNTWYSDQQMEWRPNPPFGTPFGDDQAPPPADDPFSAENPYRSAGDPNDLGDGSPLPGDDWMGPAPRDPFSADHQAGEQDFGDGSSSDQTPDDSQPHNPFSTPQGDNNDLSDGSGSSGQSTGDSARSPFADQNTGGMEGDFGDGGFAADPSDFNLDGRTDVSDLIQLMIAWGPCDHRPCSEDLDQSGVIDVDDLILLLTAFD